ncbi:MAG: response regulator, partial [Bacteroidota bacterium]
IPFGIIGLSESILERVADADVKDNIQMIVASGKRLGTLVNDLLDFSKLRNFDIELQTKPLDLRSMVAVVLRMSQPLLGWKEITLHNEVAEDLAPIAADENRLQQILHNLIGNAIKFTEEGDIVVRAHQDGDMIRVEVVDSGIGIPQEKQALIFEEFQQADGSISREFGGTGLGLTITQQLIRLHGGNIGVKSEAENQGSTFWFTMPLSSNTEQKVFQATEINQALLPLRPMLPLVMDTVSEKPRVIKKAFSEGGNMKILVVDDDPINQQVLKNHLADSDFELAFAANGEDALEVLEIAGPFDLVLLDVMMPKMSGFEVCEKIREKYLPSELPVIMVTAKNQVNDLVQGLELGANDYLAKPFSKQEFLARVHTQLDLHRIFDITGRFIPNQFIRSLGYGRITEVKLGDQVEKHVSVLFSDIRAYTSLSEQMSPADTFRFVNALHGRMGPIVQKYGGFVNQYLGDAIMAIFPETAQGALDAAIAMQKSLNEYNVDRVAKKRKPIDIGIGFHSGPLIMGIIGDEKRMDAATISDTVNTASRIESLTKHFGANILLTDVSLSEVDNPADYHLRFLGSVQVKGRQKAVRLYECYDGDTDERILLKERTIDFFELAMERYYLRDFAGAVAAFGQLLMVHPEDQIAQHFHALAEQYRIEGVEEDWTGIQRMQLK